MVRNALIEVKIYDQAGQLVPQYVGKSSNGTAGATIFLPTGSEFSIGVTNIAPNPPAEVSVKVLVGGISAVQTASGAYLLLPRETVKFDRYDIKLGPYTVAGPLLYLPMPVLDIDIYAAYSQHPIYGVPGHRFPVQHMHFWGSMQDMKERMEKAFRAIVV